ncbi:hypothetical protein OsI_35610 [Oryza sativa Indica Group]|uniref:Uncharacterized protein n=1 Tax=Oryza sativa subsp. indica TaxID=39946 RepID=B8BJS8_ORYSI|nr:hypothetical protein OsI_35610 [Oryza sativa Indica Group]
MRGAGAFLFNPDPPRPATPLGEGGENGDEATLQIVRCRCRYIPHETCCKPARMEQQRLKALAHEHIPIREEPLKSRPTHLGWDISMEQIE